MDACKCSKEHVAFDLTSRFRLKVKVRCGEIRQVALMLRSYILYTSKM